MGASVIVTGRTEAELSEVVAKIKSSGGNAFAVQADISMVEDVEYLVKTAIKTKGRVDVLVNNAGTIGPIQPLAATDPREWWDTQEVNLRGSFLITRLLLPAMIDSRGGRIINIASGAAHNVFPNLSAYAVSKAAIVHFTRCLAIEMQTYNISVIAFNPGFVVTSMLEHGATSSEVDPNSRETFRQVMETGRARSVTDIVPKLVYLVQGYADVLSGCFLDVEDDLESLAANHEDVNTNDLYTLQRKT
jgi:NAD(P)-dependent dehydrogenase (short-subunit alcohol dehydrogenase family)